MSEEDNICNIIREIYNELDETGSGLGPMMSPALALYFEFYARVIFIDQGTNKTIQNVSVVEGVLNKKLVEMRYVHPEILL